MTKNNGLRISLLCAVWVLLLAGAVAGAKVAHMKSGDCGGEGGCAWFWCRYYDGR